MRGSSVRSMRGRVFAHARQQVEPRPRERHLAETTDHFTAARDAGADDLRHARVGLNRDDHFAAVIGHLHARQHDVLGERHRLAVKQNVAGVLEQPEQPLEPIGRQRPTPRPLEDAVGEQVPVLDLELAGLAVGNHRLQRAGHRLDLPVGVEQLARNGEPAFDLREAVDEASPRLRGGGDGAAALLQRDGCSDDVLARVERAIARTFPGVVGREEDGERDGLARRLHAKDVLVLALNLLERDRVGARELHPVGPECGFGFSANGIEERLRHTRPST
jgi:hypothetical protein